LALREREHPLVVYGAARLRVADGGMRIVYRGRLPYD